MDTLACKQAREVLSLAASWRKPNFEARMKAHTPPGRENSTPLGLASILASERDLCAIMFVDVVESVRMVESDEIGAIDRWLRIEDFVDRELLPERGGRTVKRLGDGMLLEFRTVRDAIAVGFRMQDHASRSAPGEEGGTPLKLRIGVEYGEVLRNEGDIYGHSVNIAARLMSLAGTDDIVVSAQARDQLTAGLDGDLEDLGFCYLKNLTEPIRAFRVRPPGGPRLLVRSARAIDIRPVIAVIPFANRSSAPKEQPLGDLYADELIHSLSRTPELAVISRLSTTAFRGRKISLTELSAHLRPNYVITGGFRSDRSKLIVDVEMADVSSGQVVWTDRIATSTADLFSREQASVKRIVRGVSAIVLSRELMRARSEPHPNLQTYTLILAAVALIHRLAPSDFLEARALLEAAISRASHQPVAQAWLAKWHVLRVQQGWSEDPGMDARAALELTRQALGANPESSLALAVDGFVHTNLLKDFDIAENRYEEALRANPSDSFALLLRGMLHAFRDEGYKAVRDTTQALALSPLDPHRYFYDSLAASAHLTHRGFKRAADLARRSLLANRTHTSTWRVLTVALWQMGKVDEARESARQLMKLEPTLTVEGYRKRAPSAGYEICDLIVSSLASSGVPLR
jgi:class 3 adenylate cyclase/TolB-like protein